MGLERERIQGTAEINQAKARLSIALNNRVSPMGKARQEFLDTAKKWPWLRAVPGLNFRSPKDVIKAALEHCPATAWAYAKEKDWIDGDWPGPEDPDPSTLSPSSDEANEELEELKRQSAQLVERVRRQEQEIKSRDATIQNLQKALQDAEGAAGAPDQAAKEWRDRFSVLKAEHDRVLAEKEELERRLSFFEAKQVANPYGDDLYRKLTERSGGASARVPELYYDLEDQLQDALKSAFGPKFKIDKQDVIAITTITGLLRLLQHPRLKMLTHELQGYKGEYLAVKLRETLTNMLLD